MCSPFYLEANKTPTMRFLRRMASGALGRTALFVVAHEQPEIGREATRQLGAWMASESVIQECAMGLQPATKCLFRLVFPLALSDSKS